MDTPAPSPAMLGKYEIRGTLGRGAMGVVYDGWDPVIHRRVAIKTVPLLDRDDPEMQEGLARFRREAQAAGRLAHPNIVGVYDYGETADAAYIVMEYVEGGSLKDRLDRGERLSIDEIVPMMEQMLAALHFSHGRGVVHRDIKPGNVMITPDGHVKLTDFGIARIESSAMTQDGTMLGTPAYMSPEQLMAQPVDARSDIYSAGVVLYQLLTGGRPYEGGLSAIILKVFNTVPPPPSEVPGTISTAFDAVVARAMARPPERRYPTAAGFADAIREAYANGAFEPARPAPDDDATKINIAPREIAGRPAEPPPAAPSRPPAAKRSNTALLGGMAAVSLLAIGGGAWFALRPSPSPSRASGTHTAAAPALAPVAVPELRSEPAPPRPGPRQAPVQTAVVQSSPSARAAPPPPDFATLRGVLARLALTADCAVPHIGLDELPPAHVDVAGVVGSGGPEVTLREAVQAAAGVLPVTWGPMAVTGPYCGVLDLVRPVAQDRAFDLALKDNARLLRDHDPIAPTLRLPDFPAYLVVDYISSDGSVTPLYAGSAAEKPLAAGATLALRPQEVGPPFGTDMIVAFASTVPFAGQRRPGTNQTVRTYLPAMQSAIEAAQHKGAKVAARVLALQTVER